MTESDGKEDVIANVENVQISTDGCENSSKQASPHPKRVTSVVEQTSDLRSTIVMKRRRSQTPSRVTEGIAVMDATYEKEEELAKLLLQGWRRGWLRLHPPRCCA